MPERKIFRTKKKLINKIISVRDNNDVNCKDYIYIILSRVHAIFILSRIILTNCAISNYLLNIYIIKYIYIIHAQHHIFSVIAYLQ